MKKKFILIGAFIFIVSAEPTSAFTDVGENLMQWHQQNFFKSSGKIGSETAGKLLNGILQVSKEVKGVILQNKSEIANFQGDLATNLEGNIDEQKAHYINELQSSTQSLKSQSAEKMEKYTIESKKQEEDQIVDETEKILKEVLNEQK